MITGYDFTSRRFSPTAGELTDGDDDFINEGVFAKELADFLIAGLVREGYNVKFRVAEDWGNWIEIEHSGAFHLAVGCSSVEEFDDGRTLHRVITSPDKPYVRKLLRKIDVQADVEKLSAALYRILSDSDEVSDLQASQ